MPRQGFMLSRGSLFSPCVVEGHKLLTIDDCCIVGDLVTEVHQCISCSRRWPDVYVVNIQRIAGGIDRLHKDMWETYHHENA